MRPKLIKGLSIQTQRELFCAAHALNNLFHNCPERARFNNLHFTFGDAETKSTATRINLNNICLENQLRFFRESGFMKKDRVDYKKLEKLYPQWKKDLGCDQRHGDYDENVVFEAVRLAGFVQNQIWPTKKGLGVSKSDIVEALTTQKVPYGYLINTSKPSSDHWICAVFVGPKLKIIDSVNRSYGHSKDFELEKRFRAIYGIFPR